MFVVWCVYMAIAWIDSAIVVAVTGQAELMSCLVGGDYRGVCGSHIPL